ncbi:ArsR/SmtB family transcription factor [Paludifilum halophilum]|uniref:ArsR family transcriptional regulator n=1 Tax=Paludifilum halophilum TaxID=1642702 RepID=A0A235B9B5_9BACL|nr:helix-turn-helix domain-containing protein [Paludifilum halophilum]OYD08851.1 ArsR family transcriptional regulator [Paludifilum halophilum]
MSNESIQETYRVESLDQAAALLNPLRGEILTRLQDPASAAEVARELGEAPQRINYHLKALEKVGLVQRVKNRRVKNLVEVLYRSVARSFLLADTLGMSPQSLQRLKDQSSLAHLIRIAESVKTDAVRLMERSDADEKIPSATLQTEISLHNEEERQSFVEEYVELVQQLAAKYRGKAPREESASYRLTLAVYPQPGKDDSNEP